MKNYTNCCMLNRLLILLIGIAFVGCSNSDTDLDRYFASMDKTLSNEEKNILKECEDVHCLIGFMFTNSNEEFKQVADSIPISIINLLDSAELSGYRHLSLLMMYNKKRNNKVFHFSEIRKDIEVYNLKQKKNSEQFLRRQNNNLTKIAELNYEKINISDTVCLEFPKGIDNKSYEALYRRAQSKEEIITMSCWVLEKEYIPKPEEYEFSTAQFLFKFYLIDMSHYPCMFGGEEVNVGDTISIEMFFYGREVNLCIL